MWISKSKSRFLEGFQDKCYRHWGEEVSDHGKLVRPDGGVIKLYPEGWKDFNK
jgi:hypothetical protein